MILLFLMGWVTLPLALLSSFPFSAYLLQFPFLSPLLFVPHLLLYYIFLFYLLSLLSSSSPFPFSLSSSISSSLFHFFLLSTPSFPLLSSLLLSSPLLSCPLFSSFPVLSSSPFSSPLLSPPLLSSPLLSSPLLSSPLLSSPFLSSPLLSSHLISPPLLPSPPFSFSLLFSPTQCDASEATWQLIQAVLNRTDHPQPTRIMFLGGGCAPATEPLAALSGRFYNVSQVIDTVYRIAVTPLDTHPMFKLHLIPFPPNFTTAYNTNSGKCLGKDDTLFVITCTKFFLLGKGFILPI